MKVKLFDEDLKVIGKLIDRRMAKEVCELKMKKVSKANIMKVESDDLSQFFKRFAIFASWPQVLKRILLVRNPTLVTKVVLNYIQ